MARHREEKLLPWTAEQLYDLVADVSRYPEFLPWCVAVRITRRDDHVFWADLMIGFRLIRESYTSRVTLVPDREIHTVCTAGPFRNMEGSWRFVPQDDGGCLVDFAIDFEFSSRLLQRTLGSLYLEATRRLVRSFEDRARVLYGPVVKGKMSGRQGTRRRVRTPS